MFLWDFNFPLNNIQKIWQVLKLIPTIYSVNNVFWKLLFNYIDAQDIVKNVEM